MIECTKCGDYFHADEIENCPNPDCLHELCEGCRIEHVGPCLAGPDEEDDEC